MLHYNYTDFLRIYRRMLSLEKRHFKEECMAVFGWSKSTFYNKINNAVGLRQWEVKALHTICRKYEHKNC